jgi:hypothetical protein
MLGVAVVSVPVVVVVIGVGVGVGVVWCGVVYQNSDFILKDVRPR